MSHPVSAQFLVSADLSGLQSCVEKTREARAQDGQFFTPSAIARRLAGWFRTEGFNRPSVHLLDPGSGVGVLTAAVVDRIISLRASGVLPRLKSVTLEVWELDEAFIPILRQNLATCSEALERAGIQTKVILQHGNYIEGASRSLDSGLFEQPTVISATHAILNPPYRKIASSSRERALLGTVGIETSNLYSAFVSLALRQLVNDGELAAITPRSFCNGPYFREFRREVAGSASFRRVHVFDSRSEAFGRDQVLQENILFHIIRGELGKGSVTVSTGSLEAPVTSSVPSDRFISPSDPDQIIHIATESDAVDIRSFVETLPCRLSDLDIQVSTGPVVDFRLKEFLSDQLDPGCVPLIYPHCVKAGKVLAPLAKASLYSGTRISKKPVAIRETEETRKWFLESSRFVLIKRFSSKEEKRRLVAGVLDPADFPSGRLGIENHINFFHRMRSGLPAKLARGLCRFLNSTLADRYFRQFNGHTQVNASDLRAFRFPDVKTLERLGSAKLDDTKQEAIDLAMTECLGAPSFP